MLHFLLPTLKKSKEESKKHRDSNITEKREMKQAAKYRVQNDTYSRPTGAILWAQCYCNNHYYISLYHNNKCIYQYVTTIDDTQ